jgi:cytochrome c551/c552
MKARILTATLAVAALATAAGMPAQAQDALKTGTCTNCHDVDKKKVGPSLKDIAAKDQGKNAELVTKIKDGKGHPKVNKPEADIKAAVDAALATK